MPYVRCRKCRARRTLPQHPDEYLRKPPRCRCCRGREYTVDAHRTHKEPGRGGRARAATCYPGRGGCNNYSFPHRRGSGYCYHNPKLTEDMMREREECGRWA
jgi:hypothetical protein